jgi:DNA-binding protein HU-beta
MLLRHHVRLPHPTPILYPPQPKEPPVNQASLIEAVRIVGAHKNERIKDLVTKKEAAAWIDAVAGAITAEMVEGGEVAVPGLGKFKVEERAARAGRNPATGEAIQIPAKWVVTFAPTKALREALNS